MNIKPSENSLTLLEKISSEKLTLGNLLWSIRECEEETQATFAKRLGLLRQYLCDFEHNRRGLSLKKAAKLAKRLDYLEEQFVRLALQDEVDREGLHFDLEVRKLANKKLT
ncbi:helix-turn-helix domain-containing protein [Coxiella endosymbiont of Ornithodoros maritimus]|uniref:helix-turn-helix domain-containing protein n=1 Tax=Coxiella endosymbiont of Ornithodoros maritimus TaxID=1656172 RepID=UPI002263DE04|nr:helix-turn-helix transcriptional regulator [Coxiella endosymbiont of Ornithodoros maritimus]